MLRKHSITKNQRLKDIFKHMMPRKTTRVKCEKCKTSMSVYTSKYNKIDICWVCGHNVEKDENIKLFKKQLKLLLK